MLSNGEIYNLALKLQAEFMKRHIEDIHGGITGLFKRIEQAKCTEARDGRAGQSVGRRKNKAPGYSVYGAE